MNALLEARFLEALSLVGSDVTMLEDLFSTEYFASNVALHILVSRLVLLKVFVAAEQKIVSNL